MFKRREINWIVIDESLADDLCNMDEIADTAFETPNFIVITTKRILFSEQI